MEAKLNIAEILKNKPSGTKLYADAFGELSLEYINIDTIYTRTKEGMFYSFYNNGKYDKNGEPILVPSKEMRDWSKFAWKKGDVLVSDVFSTEVIFDKWYDDTYTNFYGKHRLDSEDKNNIKYNDAFLCTTGRYSLEDKDAAKTYINAIEERLGGKLNRETLEIEKQPEFKDGDIVFADFGNTQDVFIVSGKTDLSEGYYSFISLNLNTTKALNIGCRTSFFKDDINAIRYATEEEKKQLFDALAKKNKAWDSKKKEVVDLKPKWTPKPFDRVITRTPETPWTANFFSHIDSDGIKNCIDDRYIMCLPYNEETEKLIGTTNNWEG